jgi:hypothetical protein
MFCHTEKRKIRGKGSGVKPIEKSVNYFFYSFSTPILTFSLPAVPRLQLCRRGICHTTNLAIWEIEGGGQFFMHVKKKLSMQRKNEKNCP